MPLDTPSRELLHAIAERPVRSSDSALGEIAARIRDWTPIVDLAVEHRVAPLLFSLLAKSEAPVPPAAEKRLRAEYEQNYIRSLANSAELLEILQALEHGDIPSMPFKGVVLGASVWADLAVRRAGDLDLLIRFEHLHRAAAILLARGYELTWPRSLDDLATFDEYECKFERQSDGMIVELRWRLTEMKFARNLGMDWIWPHRRVATLAGAQVPNLSPEMTLLILCLHGSKHRWSRLIWICDVAQLISAFPSLDWEFILDEARRTGLSRVLALGALLAHNVAGATIPKEILAEFQSDRGSARLARHFQKVLFEMPGVAPPDRIPYGIQLLDFRDRLGLLFSCVLLAPNERDRAFVRMPRRLEWLYFLIRPVRILFDSSPR